MGGCRPWRSGCCSNWRLSRSCLWTCAHLRRRKFDRCLLLWASPLRLAPKLCSCQVRTGAPPPTPATALPLTAVPARRVGHGHIVEAGQQRLERALQLAAARHPAHAGVPVLRRRRRGALRVHRLQPGLHAVSRLGRRAGSTRRRGLQPGASLRLHLQVRSIVAATLMGTPHTSVTCAGTRWRCCWSAQARVGRCSLGRMACW